MAKKSRDRKLTVVDAVSDSLASIELTIVDLPRRKRGHSRAARRDQATYVMGAGIDRLQEQIDGDLLDEDSVDAAETLISDLKTAKDEADGAEFPGAYG